MIDRNGSVDESDAHLRNAFGTLHQGPESNQIDNA